MWPTCLLQTKTFLRQVQRDRVKSFPCDFGLASFWQFSSERPVLGRGSEILFQTILNSSLILPSCVATLNVVSHYRKPDLRDWPFKVDLSHPPGFGVRRVWCRWQRPSCRSSAGLSSVSDVLNESFAVKYPPSMSRRHERWRTWKKRGRNSLVWPHLLMCSRPFRRLCLTRVAQHRALHFGWPAAVQEGVVKRW